MINIRTIEDVRIAPTKNLVAFYNQVANKNIKKFESREKAEERVSQYLPKIQEAIVREDSPKKHRMNFRFAPEKNQTAPRDGTIRYGVYRLLDCSDGVTIQQILDKLRTKKMSNLRECLRLIHYRHGVGLWQEVDSDGETRIRIIHSNSEYLELLKLSKGNK